jgi:XTP/dITP diphosphohydrolase
MASIPKKLVFASFNPGKIEEISKTFAPLGIEVLSPHEWVSEGPEETGSTFEENALIKARFYRPFTSAAILADDSGLLIDALDGFPGVRTAEFAQDCGGYTQAFQQLEKALEGKGHDASFVSVLALLDEGGQEHLFYGETKGRLVFPGRGDFGFAYCPIFQPLGSPNTLGELSLQERSAISHRGKALNKVIAYLKA